MRVHARYSRRQILKVGGAVAVAAMLDVADILGPRAAVAGTRHRWTISEHLPSDGVFETPALHPDSTFNAVSVSWRADDPSVPVRAFVRVTAGGDAWSDWIELHRDSHGDNSDGRAYCSPLLATGADVQVRIEAAPDAGIHDLVVSVIDTAGGEEGQARARAVDPLIDGFIIPRSGWGADEALRHVDQDITKPIIWNPSYQPVEKIIIHHTATANDPADAKAALRAIYYFHAVERGWGDIGYNFVVDWQGNVYEGRFGGPNVIAGHALQYNYGSMGIALLGNFDVAEPPEAALDALVRLITVRAPHIDVTAAADFVDLVNVPNLCGHGDVLPTSCPGALAAEQLPALRGRIAGTEPVYLAPPILKEALRVVAREIGPATVYTGNVLE
ncbi:MAG: N-acetylmuramoyl-L-alanine amidase, partial [Chloroflexi bacterium]